MIEKELKGFNINIDDIEPNEITHGAMQELIEKIIIEEDKEIKYPILHKTAPSETTGDQMPNWRNLIDCNFEYLNKTICQLIDEINNLKEKKDE